MDRHSDRAVSRRCRREWRSSRGTGMIPDFSFNNSPRIRWLTIRNSWAGQPLTESMTASELDQLNASADELTDLPDAWRLVLLVDAMLAHPKEPEQHPDHPELAGIPDRIIVVDAQESKEQSRLRGLRAHQGMAPHRPGGDPAQDALCDPCSEATERVRSARARRHARVAASAGPVHVRCARPCTERRRCARKAAKIAASRYESRIMPPFGDIASAAPAHSRRTSRNVRLRR